MFHHHRVISTLKDIATLVYMGNHILRPDVPPGLYASASSLIHDKSGSRMLLLEGTGVWLAVYPFDPEKGDALIKLFTEIPNQDHGSDPEGWNETDYLLSPDLVARPISGVGEPLEGLHALGEFTDYIRLWMTNSL
jgi:hypothetical protein